MGILSIYIGTAVWHINSLQKWQNAYYSPNISIFSILLASQIAFVVPLYIGKVKLIKDRISGHIYWIGGVIISLAIVLIGLTEGRAGWLGLLVAAFYITYCNISGQRAKKLILASGFVVFFSLLSVLFFYKPDSSSGRLLISKISFLTFKDDLLWGIGPGQFKLKYNLSQAEYFANNDINGKEALLADNTFFAFNDILQILFENGVIGFLLFSFASFLLFRRIKSVLLDNESRHLFTGSVASLICLLSASLFSYPLQIFPICVQLVFCISIINNYPIRNENPVKYSILKIKFIKTFLIAVGIALLTHSFFLLDYNIRSHRANELSMSGFKKRAIEKYQVLSKSYIHDGPTLLAYAKELYNTNQMQEARNVLTEAQKYYQTNEVYKLFGRIEEELNNYPEAEKHYKVAMYMVPNRVLSRFELLEFYIRQKDTSNAVYWAKSIINMPIKIPSQITYSIKQRTKAFLKELDTE